MVEEKVKSAQKETKEEKFRRLANARVNRALKSIRVIGNLANSATYNYTDGQVNQIVKALRAEVKELQQRFNGGPDGVKEFKLK